MHGNPSQFTKEFKNTSKNVLWLDAGCLINKKLSLLKIIIKKNGFYSPQSSDNVEKWTHEQTLNLLKAPNSILRKEKYKRGYCWICKKFSSN